MSDDLYEVIISNVKYGVLNISQTKAVVHSTINSVTCKTDSCNIWFLKNAIRIRMHASTLFH